MPIPSAFDVLQRQIPDTCKIVDRSLGQRISRHEPKGTDRNTETVEKALRRIREELALIYENFRALFAGITQLRKIALMEEIKARKEDTQRALDLLEGTFGTDIGKGSTAETLAVQIAENHGRFHARMVAMLEEVERISTQPAADKSAPPVKVVKKPAPKPEGKAGKPGPQPVAGTSEPLVQITVNPAPKPVTKDTGAAVIPLNDTPEAPLEPDDIGLAGGTGDDGLDWQEILKVDPRPTSPGKKGGS